MTILSILILIVGGAASAGTVDGKSAIEDRTLSNQRARVRAAARSKAKGWNGLVPLRSTRRDVEAVVGNPTTPGGSSYETASERVFAQYSDGPCERGWPFGWNTARDTVVLISIIRKESMSLADLGVDVRKYEKWPDRHIDGEVHYTDRAEGIDIQVDEPLGKILSVSYMPSATDEHLRCPEAKRRLPPGRGQADSFFKFDTFGDVPAAQEYERLDSLAAELLRQPDTVGYIIAYASMRALIGEAKGRASCARDYLLKKHRIKPERIRVIDGGYRQAREVELYVEPRKGPVPLAVPSVRPSKVKILGQKKSMRCGSA